MPAQSMEDIVSLCKRRGFIFQSADIYGGLKGVYDYGPLGVELKNNLKAAWWRSVVHERDDIEGLDASILGHRLVYKYSGHADGFSDPLVECKDCNHRMRADKMKDTSKCDSCSSSNITEPRQFNMMFSTHIGPVANDENIGYLRPETAQGIFINFKNVVDATSRKLPFGIAQIGKSFRNEITARNFIFRLRELEQMELEFFVEPGTDEEWHDKWLQWRLEWWQQQGLSKENLDVEDVAKDELAHYSKRTYDLLYKYPHGFDEIEGIANRTDYDLGNHSKNQDELNIQANVHKNTDSTAKLAIIDPQAKTTTVPFVIEPAAGVDRGVLAVLCEAFTKEKLDDGKERIVLKLRPHLAPIKVAVIPLARNNEKLVAKATEIKQSLQRLGLGRILLENSGNIGKSYRRHDEVGTPLCVTVDFETIEEEPESITLRDRDSMEQKRIPLAELRDYVLSYYLEAESSQQQKAA